MPTIKVDAFKCENGDDIWYPRNKDRKITRRHARNATAVLGYSKKGLKK